MNAHLTFNKVDKNTKFFGKIFRRKVGHFYLVSEKSKKHLAATVTGTHLALGGQEIRYRLSKNKGADTYRLMGHFSAKVLSKARMSRALKKQLLKATHFRMTKSRHLQLLDRTGQTLLALDGSLGALQAGALPQGTWFLNGAGAQVFAAPLAVEVSELGLQLAGQQLAWGAGGFGAASLAGLPAGVDARLLAQALQSSRSFRVSDGFQTLTFFDGSGLSTLVLAASPDAGVPLVEQQPFQPLAGGYQLAELGEVPLGAPVDFAFANGAVSFCGGRASVGFAGLHLRFSDWDGQGCGADVDAAALQRALLLSTRFAQSADGLAFYDLASNPTLVFHRKAAAAAKAHAQALVALALPPYFAARPAFARWGLPLGQLDDLHWPSVLSGRFVADALGYQPLANPCPVTFGRGQVTVAGCQPRTVSLYWNGLIPETDGLPARWDSCAAFPDDLLRQALDDAFKFTADAQGNFYLLDLFGQRTLRLRRAHK